MNQNTQSERARILRGRLDPIAQELGEDHPLTEFVRRAAESSWDARLVEAACEAAVMFFSDADPAILTVPLAEIDPYIERAPGIEWRVRLARALEAAGVLNLDGAYMTLRRLGGGRFRLHSMRGEAPNLEAIEALCAGPTLTASPTLN